MAAAIRHLWLLIAYSSISYIWKTEAGNVTLFNIGNKIYTLSDELVDANTAASNCELLGGALAVVKDQVVKDKFYHEIINKYYNPDLQRVHIFYDKLSKKTVYKFSNDSAIVGGWKNANELGQLSYLDFYKTNDIQREAVYFCQYIRQRWRVVTPGESSDKGPITDGCPTNESWTSDFRLYARNSSATGLQPIYNFWRNKHLYYGSMLTNTKRTYDEFNQLKKTFYLPVRSVFVGARYNTSSKQWLWIDGTNANFTTTHTTCKQKAFSYGIEELENGNCTEQLAYYSCEVKSNLTTWITTEECNSTVIKVNWSNDFYKVAKQMELNLTIKIDIERNNSDVVTIIKALQTNSTAISGLQQRTSYRLKVTFYDSNNISIVSSHNVTTGFGRPDPITDAYVKSPPPCVIAFNKTALNDSATSYKITASSTNSETNHMLTKDNFQGSDEVLIDTSSHGRGVNITFTVKSFSCEGESTIGKVEGVCYWPLPTTTVSVTTPNPSAVVTGISTTSDAATTKPEIETDIKTSGVPGIPTSATYPYITDGDPLSDFNIWILGGAGGAGVLFLLLVVVACIVYRRYARNVKQDKVEPIVRFIPNDVAESWKDDVNKAGPSRSLENFESPYVNVVTKRPKNAAKNKFKLKIAYEKKSAENCKIFYNEFQEIVRIDKSKPKSCQQASSDLNAPRNRYKNIFTYDHSRVFVFGGSEGNDYINASYIPGYQNDKKFIATQGPKPNTIPDFWLMVWQQESPLVVMLTRLTENGKKKCDLYWPDLGRQETYGLVIVTLEDEIHIGGIIRRKFTLKKQNLKKTLVHLQYTTWPDHGIPVTTSNMLYLRKMVEEARDISKPLIIHCSAGVGRTGTYIAMDTLFNQLDAKEHIDVSAVVSRMRENRTNMVQTLEQYKFIHKLLAEHEMFPDFDRSTSDLQTMTEDELNLIGSEEFALLSEALGNADKIYDNFSVLTWVDRRQEVVKLNASFIQDFCPIDFIASQHPTSESEQVFWKAAVEQRVDVVVRLQDDQLDPFDSVDSNSPIVLGDNISIQITSINDGEERSKKSLLVKVNGAIKASRKISYLVIKGWSDPGAPPSVDSVLEAIASMHRLQRNVTRAGRVLVCCKDGRNRTGVFIALVNILERVMAQNKVDVFRTVKDLRDMRRNMVDNLDSYMFIYNAVLAYLSSANPYEN